MLLYSPQMTSLHAAGALWAVFAIYWLLAAFGRNRAQRRESPLARLAHTAFIGAAFAFEEHRRRTGFFLPRFH